MEFHQPLVDNVVEATDELIRFWRLRVKVKVATRSHVQNLRAPCPVNSLKDPNQIRVA